MAGIRGTNRSQQYRRYRKRTSIAGFYETSRAREEELLQAAETGDVPRLRDLLCPARDLNIDCTDQLGRTPLHLAVVNEHKEAVKILLDHVDKRRVYQALLSAINQGNEEIAETIIEHPKYAEISNEVKEHGRAYFYLNKFHDENQFSEEITPLMLASQQNRFEVVMALLLKGEIIEKPHKCNCACAECKTMTRKDELRFARSRLNTYRALSSEAYISLSSDDPILTCFELRKELHQVASEEKYYAIEYTNLATTLSDYVVRLLDKVHGNEELHAILSATTDADPQMDPEGLPRLQLAIKYKEKKFVAHPSCQKKLSTLWGRGFQKILHSRSGFIHTAAIGCVVILYPLLATIFIFTPRSKIGRLVRTPCIKFVAQATSYLLFLSLILIHGQVEQGKLCSSRMRDYRGFSQIFHEVRLNLSEEFRQMDRTCIRHHHPALLEFLIVLWIAGMVWHAIKQIYTSGMETHFMDVYNAMDFFMLKFYIASLMLRRLADFKVQTALEYFGSPQAWLSLGHNNTETLAAQNFYWINADRFYWDAWDPVHMYEALFSVGNIINFARLFHILAISEHLGPMLICLERMLKDVMKFMVTFVLIFLAFMVGMYNLYWYYYPKVKGQAELIDHHIETRAGAEFANLEHTFRSIFWALFGLRDSKSVELGQGYRSRLTESVGYIVFGVYNWGAVIVLLNMLIAMMTRSFDKIATDQETEWKFVRSKLYMQYIKDDCTLPVPLNLVPTPKSISKLVRQAFTWESRGHKNVDEEEGAFMGINGGGRLLSNKDEPRPGAAVDTMGFHKPKKGDPNRRKSSSFGKRLIHSLSVRKFPSLACNEDSDEYKAVIKRVVRRYIFEHLLASVTPNDGNDIEGLKMQTSIIQSDIHALKPRIEDQFQKVQSDYSSVSRNMAALQRQLDFLTTICANIQSNTNSERRRYSRRHYSSFHSETDSSEDCCPAPEVTTSRSHERLLMHPEERPKRPLRREETRL